jgi:hypothetical protein
VRDEQELDRFLGDLIRRVGRTVGTVVRSPVGQAIGSTLKGVVRAALPIAGGALGTFVGGPLGTAIGSNLASMAGRALGLELEGLSPEDREFEAARQFIRFASEAVKVAALSPSPDPAAAARFATAAAARRFAPGLARGATASVPAMRAARGGRWMRQGRNIVVVNCYPPARASVQ